MHVHTRPNETGVCASGTKSLQKRVFWFHNDEVFKFEYQLVAPGEEVVVEAYKLHRGRSPVIHDCFL